MIEHGFGLLPGHLQARPHAVEHDHVEPIRVDAHLLQFIEDGLGHRQRHPHRLDNHKVLIAQWQNSFVDFSEAGPEVYYEEPSQGGRLLHQLFGLRRVGFQRHLVWIA